MTTDILLVVVGLVILTWSADRFVEGAAALAIHFGVSALIIGIVVMGFGTSAPELLISSLAAVQGKPGVSIGNALGSNISNIALIGGTVALIAPVRLAGSTLRREFRVLFAATAGALLLLVDGDLGRLDGALLCVGLVLSMGLLVTAAMAERRAAREAAAAARTPVDLPETIGAGRATLLLVAGLGLLLLSSHMLVTGATGVAAALGVSELVIGLTIVAVGTSLPELAASVASAMKKQQDLAIGNVIGSNLFNTLAVLGLPGLIRPGPLPDEVLARDYPIMVGLTTALFAAGILLNARPGLHRAVGALLVAAFAGYQVLLFATAAA